MSATYGIRFACGICSLETVVWGSRPGEMPSAYRGLPEGWTRSHRTGAGEVCPACAPQAEAHAAVLADWERRRTEAVSPAWKAAQQASEDWLTANPWPKAPWKTSTET